MYLFLQKLHTEMRSFKSRLAGAMKDRHPHWHSHRHSQSQWPKIGAGIWRSSWANAYWGGFGPRISFDEYSGGESSSRVSRNIPVDSFVSDIAQELCEQKPTVPEVNEDLAGMLNRRWATKISDKDLSEKFDLIQCPENLSGLIRSRVNSKIFV